MATETLSFLCPHCDTRLTVPAALAGVKGPCPHCRNSITAPVPDSGPSPFGELPPEAPVPEEAVPVHVPAPAEPVEMPLPRPEAPVTAPLEVLPAHGHASAEEEPLLPDGPKIRPEPRHMKERVITPMAVRHSTADDRLQRRGPMQSARSRHYSRLLHALIPALFCAIATIVSGLLLYHYLPSGPMGSIRNASAPLPPPPAAPKKNEEVIANPAPHPEPVPTPTPQPGETLTPLSGNGSAPEPPAPPPETTEAAPNSAVPEISAAEVLENFLKAKDARSRLEMVEPAAKLEELEANPFTKGPLWEVAQILGDLPQSNALEQVTDYPFRVSFVVPGRKNVEIAMLVRQRGTQAPKVFLPAFVDLAGGRLANFTREPNTQDPATFHVVLEPISGCHEDGVPNPETKFTLRLMPSTLGKETARAYVETGSRFGKMMEQPESSLRWGVRLRATVTLQWNHKEDPAKPFLELMDINSLGWNL